MHTTRKVGRPCKLDVARAKVIVEAVAAGNPYATAARAAGVHPKTFGRWMRRGRSDAPDDAEFRAFRSAIQTASAKAEQDALALVLTAAKNPDRWTAAAWFLERRNPRRWGRVDRLKAETLHRIEDPPKPLVDREWMQRVLAHPDGPALIARLDAISAPKPWPQPWLDPEPAAEANGAAPES